MRSLPVTALTVLPLAIGPTLATNEAAAKACGPIRVNGSYYVVGGPGVSCKYMRRWSRLMVRDGRKPRGWDKCTIRRSGSGGCQRGPASDRDFFIYYPPD